jgi:hypothetical protein
LVASESHHTVVFGRFSRKDPAGYYEKIMSSKERYME